jgi:hypothetical protein
VTVKRRLVTAALLLGALGLLESTSLVLERHAAV